MKVFAALFTKSVKEYFHRLWRLKYLFPPYFYTTEVQLLYLLEVGCAVLTEGTDIICRKCIALVNVSAYLADVSLLAFSFGLGLDVVMIVGVGHSFSIGDNSCFGYRADEHSVSVEVDVLLNLKRHKGVDISRKEYQTII